MKTILVPTDFSDQAENAIGFAAELAKRVNAKLLLFHAYHIPVIATDVPVAVIPDTDLEEETLKSLQKIAGQLKEKYGITTECAVAAGFAVDEIAAKSKSKNIDLIIMGTQGASGLKEALVGSNAASVVQRAECPVLVVPPDTRFTEIKKITYATEINDKDFRPLRKLAEIANMLDAEIEVVHIVVKEAELDKSLFEWYKEMARDRVPYPKMTFHLFESDDILNTLDDFTRLHKTNLLAMSTHRRTLFGRIFGRSLTKKMTYHTHLPLLTFHIPDNADYFLA